MYHINKLTFFHGFLIAMVSVCNYFIKINDATAAACTATHQNSCASQCGNLSILKCDYNSSTGYVSCTCGCDSALLAEYGALACQWATQRHGNVCSQGGLCSYSGGRQMYCFSARLSNCSPNSHMRCFDAYPFSFVSTASTCQYSSQPSGRDAYCRDLIYYGNSCENTCPLYNSIVGQRSTNALGGQITDCKVYVPAGCDETGCYNSHTCPYVK